MATAAKPDGDDVLLTGVKKWISFGQLADLFLVFARSAEGISAYLVERDSPGLEVVAIEGMLGTRGAMLAELRLTECRVPAANVIGPPGRAHPFVTTSTLTLGRYSVACGSVGIARACLDASITHARARGLLDHQLVQRLITRMTVQTDAARLLALQAGELIGRASADGPMAVARAKYFAAVAAGDASRDAVQIHGAAGCSPGLPVERLFRDAKVMEIIEGSSEVLESLIGRAGHRALPPADAPAPQGGGR
jgi:alkylation response protein AidB-like acyl-CoA dehydrogenase